MDHRLVQLNETKPCPVGPPKTNRRVLTKCGPLEKKMANHFSIFFLENAIFAQNVTGNQWRNNSKKKEEMEPKQKQHPVVVVTGDGSEVRCSKEQYCIGTWNVRSMNQGKLEVVKQMARANINILGISELKWTEIGKFNSDGHYIYYCGQEFLRRNGVAHIVNKRV